MPFLDTIVSGLNAAWKQDGFSCESLSDCTMEFNGVGETILDASQESEGPAVRYPGIVNDEGEVRRIFLDDQKAIILWHRVEGIVNGESKKSAFGDSPGDPTETVNMAVVLMAWRGDVKKPVYQLEAILKDKMPLSLAVKDDSGATLQTSYLHPGASTFDKLALLQREFSEIDTNYPNLVAFEMKYRIESIYKKGCLDPC